MCNVVRLLTVVNFVNLGRPYSVGNERFFFLKFCGEAFSMHATEIWVWAFYLLDGILGEFY